MTDEPKYPTYPKHLAHAQETAATRDDGRLLFVFKEGTSPTEIRNFFESHNKQYQREDQSPANVEQQGAERGPRPRLNQTERHVWVRLLNGGPANLDELEKLFTAPTILEWIGPVYRAQGNPELRYLFCAHPLTLAVLPTVKGQSQPHELDELLTALGLQDGVEKPEQHEQGEPAAKTQPKQVAPKSSQEPPSPIYCKPLGYDPDAPHQQDPSWYEKAGQLLRQGKDLVSAAQYDCIPLTSPLCMVLPSNEQHWNDQWNLQRIGMPAAWDVGLGDENVYICVIDNGCQSVVPDDWQNPQASRGYHPELSRTGNYGVSASGAPGSKEGGPSAPDTDKEQAHATACAGIAAAELDSVDGVVGMAPNCRIFSLALPQPFTAGDIDAAIRTAANPATPLPNKDPAKHRRVILLSLAHNGLAGDPLVKQAIDYAVANNVVVVVPTGNDDNPLSVTPPADHPKVIAVGAADSSPEGRATNQSLTPGILNWGNNTWGSNGTRRTPFVCAPGVEIPTTDLRDVGASPGYVAQDNYVLNVSGTSAAAAHVAGLAALLLSQNPALPESQVRHIIAMTCEKFGTVPYSPPNFRHPDGTWNNQVGYGLINAPAALAAGRP